MTDDMRASTNAEQQRYWNDKGGPAWVASEQVYDGELAPLGQVAIDRAKIVAGDRVLDVGCGMGHSLLRLAEIVGPRGSVVGIDIAEPMIERAQERVRDAGLKNIQCLLADAQTHQFSPDDFNVIYSRFGVMFFEDPVAAFQNLLRTLQPGGRLSFVCWRSPDQNEWVEVLFEALRKHVSVDSPPTEGPAPFGFSNEDTVRSVLTSAGFRDVNLDRVDEPLRFGGSGPIEHVAQNIMKLTVVTRALDKAGVTATSEIAKSVQNAIQPFGTDDGVQLGSASWVVTASR